MLMYRRLPRQLVGLPWSVIAGNIRMCRGSGTMLLAVDRRGSCEGMSTAARVAIHKNHLSIQRNGLAVPGSNRPSCTGAPPEPTSVKEAVEYLRRVLPPHRRVEVVVSDDSLQLRVPLSDTMWKKLQRESRVRVCVCM